MQLEIRFKLSYMQIMKSTIASCVNYAISLLYSLPDVYFQIMYLIFHFSIIYYLQYTVLNCAFYVFKIHIHWQDILFQKPM